MQVGEILSILDNIKRKKISKLAKSPKLKANISFVISGYNSAKNVIREYKDSYIMTVDHLSTLKLTEHMRKKIINIIRSKPNKGVQPPTTMQKTSVKLPPTSLLAQLTTVPGIGTSKAQELIAANVQNIKQLMNSKFFKLLPKESKAFLTTSATRTIPASEIKKLKPLLTSYTTAPVYIVGSYKRGAPFSRDIDILIISNDNKIISKYTKWLSKKIHLTPYLEGTDKMSAIIAVNKNSYKIDVFAASKLEKPFALLYSIGPKELNIRMRQRAKSRGFLLNQRGLYNRITKERIPVKNEKNIFLILGEPYKQPNLRK